MSGRNSVSHSKFLQKFKKNQTVAILQNPSSKRGMPHPRFKGKMSKVIGKHKQDKAYIIEILDENNVKRLIYV